MTGRGSSLGIGTRAVHAGYDPAFSQGAASPPIWQSAGFAAETSADLIAIASGQKRGTQDGQVINPTVQAAAQRVAALEGAEACLLYPSGAGALAGALAPLVSAGDEIVVLPALGSLAQRYFREILPRQGITVTWAPGISPDDVHTVVSRRTRVIYAETPSQPLLRVADVAGLADVARVAGARLAVEGSASGPVNQQLLSQGADLVIYTSVCGLNGHGDLSLGAVCGSSDLLRDLRTYQLASGGQVEPQAAWLLLRGLATLPLRMRQQTSSAQVVAEFLEAHPKVNWVQYPGLASHPDHRTAASQMRGWGGLLAFEMFSPEAARVLTDQVRLFRIGTLTGGVESQILPPALAPDLGLSPEQRRAQGITDSLVRISVGIEEIDDLITDLALALEQVP